MEGTGSFLLFLTNSQGKGKRFCEKTINCNHSYYVSLQKNAVTFHFPCVQRR